MRLQLIVVPLVIAPLAMGLAAVTHAAAPEQITSDPTQLKMLATGLG